MSNPPPVVVSLPIADRSTSFTFFRELGFDAIGEPDEDGVPEPLQFELGTGVRLMLVPTGGFGWVIGPHEVAAPRQSECVLSLGAGSDAAVDDLVKRAASVLRKASPFHEAPAVNGSHAAQGR